MRSQIKLSICKSHLSPYASYSGQKFIIEEHSSTDDLLISVMIYDLLNVRYRYRVKRSVLIMVCPVIDKFITYLIHYSIHHSGIQKMNPVLG